MAREWLVPGVPRACSWHDSLLPRRHPAHADRLLASLVALDAPLAFLLVLPLAALLAIFARSARPDRPGDRAHKAYRGTALLRGEVISDDDEYTGQPATVVLALALKIAERDGPRRGRVRLVEFGALLHDVGKIAVPKRSSTRRARLDDEEWALMSSTRSRAADARQGRRSMADVGVIVRASHERWDGKGYPDGTAGEDVPWRPDRLGGATRSARSRRRAPTVGTVARGRHPGAAPVRGHAVRPEGGRCGCCRARPPGPRQPAVPRAGCPRRFRRRALVPRGGRAALAQVEQPL